MGAKLCLTDKVSGIDWTHGYVLTAVVLKELKQDFNGVVLDFGTARGFSAIALAEAIRESESNLPVVTMDILPHDEKMFWNSPIDRNGKQSRAEIWSQLDAGDSIIFLEGPISQSLRMLGMNRIRLAFLDSQHSREQVETELSYVSARQKSGDIVVLDDFGSSGFHGVVAGAQSVFSRNNYSKVAEVSSLHKTVAVWKKN